MDVLKSLSAFFSSVPTPTKRRQEPSPPATVKDLSHWLTNHETVYGQQILDDTLRGLLKNPAGFERLLPHQRTPEICLAAVEQQGHAIHYLTEAQRAPAVCLAAVQQNGYAIKHLTNAQRSPEVCLAAVQQNGSTIEYLTEEQRTPGVCRAAVQSNGFAIRWLTEDELSADVCMAAVQQNGHAIQHLTDAHRTPVICLVALQAPLNEWREGSPVKHMSLRECVHPVVSSWIIANWDACVGSLGNTRAAEVAQAILRAREQADEPHPQERSEDRSSAQRGE